MKILKYILLLISLLLLKLSFYSQNIDSINHAFITARHDTTRAKILVELSEILYSSNPDTVKTLCEKAIQIIDAKINKSSPIEKKSFLIIKATAYNNIGAIFNYQGNIPKALSNFQKSLRVQEELVQNGAKETELKLGIAIALNNIGSIYHNQGDISKALDNYFKSLVMREAILLQTNDSTDRRDTKKGISTSLNNIGAIYDSQGDALKALIYYRKSLKIRQEINDKKGIANSFNNIGYIYRVHGDPEFKASNTNQTNTGIEQALKYYNKSLKIREEINDKKGIGYSLNNIGFIYYTQADFKSKGIERDSFLNIALEYCNKSLKNHEKINEKEGIAAALNNLSGISLKQGKLALAKKYAERSLILAKEIGFPEDMQNISELLSKIYSKTENWKGAYNMQVLYKQMTDSINNESNRKASIQKGFEYEYEKKAITDSVKAGEERKVFELQSKQEKTQRTALYFGIGLIAIFSLFMYNRFRITHKQKKLIEIKEKETHEQKIIIEEKHKEITDSINYAERIQRSFLASAELLDANLNHRIMDGAVEATDNYFVYFQPKDVVSGDFYWASKIVGSGGVENFILATADSTGHGVPGAIMSILNISCLEKSVEEEKMTEPSDILNHTRLKIIERLKKDGSADGGKDGMDCSLICFDFINSKLTYAAANNPVWIIRKKSSFEDAVELIELAPDKMPVGKHDKDFVPFKQHSIDLQKGDIVYALTDGYPDQFGGSKGKKFMYKKLKELLITSAHMSMTQQSEILNNAFKEWKGDLEQVDDVTIIGIRI